MLRIRLNGEPMELMDGTTIEGLAELLWTGAGLWPALVVIDWKVVEPAAWRATRIHDGAAVEISGSDQRPLG